MKLKSGMKKILEKDLTLWWVFSINFTLFNISMCMHPFSETGDDDILMGMFSGCFGEPAVHLIFINICLVSIIRIFAVLFPGVNWYFTVQYIFLFVAFFAIVYVLLKVFGEKSGALFSILILMPYAYEGYVSFQFTKTAGILTAAGCFYLFYCMQKRMTWISCIFGIVLVWLGSCYRFAMSAAVTAVFIGSMMCSLGMEYMIQRKRIALADFKQKKVIMLIVLILGMLGLRSIDNLMYQSEEWQEYKEYNYYRGYVRDFPVHAFEGNEEAYTGIGITRTEYDNLMNWNIADPEVYTLDQLKAISSLKDKNGNTAKVSSATFLGFLQFLTNIFVKNKMFVLFWGISILLLIVMPQKRKCLMNITVNFLLVLGVNLVFYLRGRYGINRVDICIWLAAILSLLAQTGKNLPEEDCDHTESGYSWKWCAYFCICIISAGLTGRTVKQHLEMWNMEKQVQADYQEILKYIDADKEGYYFMDACAAHYGYGILWYQPYPQNYCEKLVYLGGWYTNSPIALKQWAQNDIKNPFRDMCEIENAYIVDRYDHVDTILSYLQEHYDKSAEISLVLRIGDYKIYRMKTAYSVAL